MDQPFKAFAEPSCFTSTFDCEFDNTAADPFEETEAQRMYRRKLSFRDTFDFENNLLMLLKIFYQILSLLLNEN